MFTGKNVVKSQKTKFRKNREFDEDNEIVKEKRKIANKQIYRYMKEEDEYEWDYEEYSR